MWWVIRLSIGLIGVLVVGLAGGLGVLRASDEPRSTIVVLIEAEYGKQYYALFEPQSGKTIQITPPYFAITGKGISLDGRWLYFVETREGEANSGDILNGRLRRVALTVQSPADELLLHGINFRYTAWSPDFRWLLYVDNYEQHLFAANPLTGERRNLTSKLSDNLRVPSHQLESVSFDGEWVRFFAWEGMNANDIHYRVRLDGTGLEHIGNVDGIHLFWDKPENGHWYVGYKSDDYHHIYRVRDDLQAAFIIDSIAPTLYDPEFKYWLTDDVVLLQSKNEVATYDTITAVRITDGQALWSIDHILQHWHSPDGSRVFFRRFDYTLRRSIVEGILPDGTDRRVVPIAGGDVMDDMTAMEIFDWTSESNWWFYTFYNFQMARYELHRLSADWQTDETLWTDKNRLLFQKWQGNKLIFSVNRGYYDYSLAVLYQLDGDTLEVVPIMQPTSRTWIVLLDGPTIDPPFRLLFR